MDQHVVITGSPFCTGPDDGMTLYGPFDNYAAAKQWQEQQERMLHPGPYFIVPVHKPTR